MERFQTFHNAEEVTAYFDIKDKNSLVGVLNDKFVIANDSYSNILKKLDDMSVQENPLFYDENKVKEIELKYQLLTKMRFTARHLEKCKTDKKCEEYAINISHPCKDLLIGITCPNIEDIEYIYFDGQDGIKLPKHNEILYTKEKMPYIPISSLPLVLCAMCYVYPKKIHIKFKQTRTPSEIFAYYQNTNNRDSLILPPHYFRDGDHNIIISNGFIGTVPFRKNKIEMQKKTSDI